MKGFVQVFPGVLMKSGKLYTSTSAKTGFACEELREWNPYRSKLAAAVLKGLKTMPLKKGSKVLYLGASTGTTCSHISDIIGSDGIIYAVEFSERVFRELVSLCKQRKNIVPILADARKTREYAWIEEVDSVYCDIAQPDETEIALRNCEEFLKSGGHMLIAIKSQSIDMTKKPEQIYKQEAGKIEKKGFRILDMIDIGPYEEKHAFIAAKMGKS